jgi:hypothetical protein
VYREVVKPYGRGCHLALDDASAPPAIRDFNTYDELRGFIALPSVCKLYDMPHAEVTRRNFWQSPARGHMIGVLDWPTACQ